MDVTQLKAALSVALLAAGIALLKGKALRRLLLLPLEWLAGRTTTKVDDVIVAEAERDLGIESPTLEASDATETEK